MPESFSNFYRGKRVLVTGHTGFKGGWLSSWLKFLGAKVFGIGLNPNTEPNLFTTARVGEGMSSSIGDLRDFRTVSTFFNQHSPQIVIHNAAQALVRRSYREPVQTYATNVMGTVHVLEAARQTASVRAVVVVTSDKCYENREWVWGYRESDPVGGHDPYSSSKGAAEIVTAGYRNSFFSENRNAGIASARAGNVIGGGDWSEDRLVPDIVRGIASGVPVVIRRPQSIRPWQHVLEPLRGYLLLAQRLHEGGQEFAEPWNFGPRNEDAITVSELAQRVISLWGKGSVRVEQEVAGLHEAQYLRLTCEKAKARLGWSPVLTLREALEWTVDWYREYYENPNTACRNTQLQIERYMRKADL